MISSETDGWLDGRCIADLAPQQPVQFGKPERLPSAVSGCWTADRPVGRGLLHGEKPVDKTEVLSDFLLVQKTRGVSV
jgi:hypothetical protein